MDRVLQSTPASPSATFYVDGAVVDPGTVTVNITREDGTSLVTGGSTTGSGAAARTFSLTAVQSASLDLLRFDWLSASQGTITTWVEIVGGFLFSLAEARALPPLSNTTTYPTADVVAARTAAETALEEACGVAFVPRYCRETRTGNNRYDLIPRRPKPLSLQSVTIGGTTITDAVIDDESLGGATFWRQAGWPGYVTRRNIVIKYTHGYQITPPRVAIACLKLTKRILVDSPISDRATVLTDADGSTQFFVTAGVRSAVFDVPECNAVVQEYQMDRYGVA